MSLDLFDLADVCRNRHRGADTSEAAFAETPASRREHDRQRILDLIRRTPGGLACFEVEGLLGIRHESASARLTDLQKVRLIADSGERRKTVTGRAARVYVAAG